MGRCAGIDTDPGEPCPIILVAVEEEGHPRVAIDVSEAGETASTLRFLIDGDGELASNEGVTNRHEVRPAIRRDGREAGDSEGMDKR